jgi:predicted aminopeptidase
MKSLVTGRFLRRTPLLLLILMLGGCATLGYYGQSIGGQWEVWEKEQPIDELLAAPDTPAELREKLQSVLRIRDFASNELALPENDSYRSYADLQRPYVVWNVFAAKPYELTLKRWCFLFAGCVGYRGYFSQAAAEEFAGKLVDEGLEVYVGGVAAYSTLGWFDDPLLNTVVNRSSARIAGLLFHELAHQQLYVEGDTSFNEGFATTVQLEGVRRWLEQNGNEQQRQDYVQFQRRQNDFVTLVTQARDRLQAMYQQGLSEAEMSARKVVIKAELREQYQRLKKTWGGYKGYDEWFAQDLNNAQLAAVTTYRDRVSAFQRLLAKHDGDLVAFYRACAELGEMAEEERVALLGK